MCWLFVFAGGLVDLDSFGAWEYWERIEFGEAGP